MNARVLLAVFKRNFVSYFANPTGYVFICLFVLLSSFTAFWPNEFFNTNLANLSQLSAYFPFIMLVFVPAITMSVWADERRQGTDELLLTIPASDLDVVLGKYLAAVAIFTVSLLFSFVCNLWVLETLGSPDLGLFIGTYVGYWLIGLAMLAVGMVASFLTGNLTVAFILGALFNAPLVFMAWLDMPLKQWSIGEQFTIFGRGIISFPHLLYFLTIVAVMLYLSIVFIGRRHWRSGASSLPNFALYFLQVAALTVIGANLCLIAGRASGSLRLDVTSERLSSLSKETVDLLDSLEIERPVQIEAFISPEVPELYVQTRLDLLTMLQELKAAGGKNVVLKVNSTERFSDASVRAEQRYGIRERRVFSRSRGAVAEEFIYMGVAFTCGLDKVILPFVDRGIPVEYELVRSISTITQQKRKRVGVLMTDAQLYGQFNMQAMSSSPDWPIIAELEKQYEVEKVDATNPITERYDALLAVQPSSLGPPQWDNFTAAIRAGQPTVIFEDPFPLFAPGVPATSPDAPRRAPGGMNPMMGGRQQPPPKADPQQLAAFWSMLGVDFAPNQIIWQDYNPYKSARQFPKEFVFVDKGSGADEPFAEAESGPGAKISSGFEHMLFPFPGAISPLNASEMDFTPLARTGEDTGTVDFNQVMQMNMFGQPAGLKEDRRQVPRNMSYIMAAHISGRLPDNQPPVPGGESDETEASKSSQVNVVLVADIDLLSPQFFQLREHGTIPEEGMTFDFDNVSFVLNVLDQLAGDDRFIEIRKRRTKHRTLAKIEEKTKEARVETTEKRDESKEKLDKAVEEQQQALKDEMAKLQEDLQKQENVNLQAVLTQVATVQKTRQQRLDRKIEQLNREKDDETEQIDRKLDREIRKVEDGYKLRAVLLPPIPPLILAVLVLFIRRYKEREGVSRSRLK